MVEVFTARSGRMSLRADGVALHSPYDPEREAAQFVDSSFPEEAPPSVVILLGEALGYACALILSRFPLCRVIPIFYSEEIFRHSPDPSPYSWHPGSPIPLLAHLRSAIGEHDVEGLRVVEWPASARVFPVASREAHRSVVLAIREATGSFMTAIGAGRIWIRNSILAFLSLDSALSGAPCQAEIPVLIAASGPSLEDLLPAIRAKRSAFQLWALPSSIRSLHDAGIAPDLVILTDPGFWAVSHLHFSACACPIAMPLSASRGPVGMGLQIVILRQPFFAEEELIRRADLSALDAPPHGTVAATAIDLALRFCRAKVMIAGLDLCLRDIRSHARPNAFDRLLMLRSSRRSPHYSQSFQRASMQPFDLVKGPDGMVRIPSAHKTYAGWLGSESIPTHGRVFRLNASPVALSSMQAMDEAELLSLPARLPGAPTLSLDPTYPSLSRRRSIAGILLDEWEQSLEKGIGGAGKIDGFSMLDREPVLFFLAHNLEAQRLSEVGRALRTGKTDSARETLVRLLQDARARLRDIRSKAGI